MPIIGNGDIATALKYTDNVVIDREDVIFFASGVSNSSEIKPEPYQRELTLLMSQPKDKHLVYFSSLSIYYSKTEYARHKRIMENTIRNHWNSYTIVRIGNIDWGKNPNTLINYLTSHPNATIQNVYRHILSFKEFQYWMKMIIVPGKNEMNITGRWAFVPHLMNDLKSNKSIND
tara:strand:+ start:274 stop:798 length:525 start_codon:yes stop_codon:yes gene_type:complete